MAGSPAAAPNPLLILHRGLRGRYPLAIGLGLTFGLVFASLGYLLVKPVYQSVGLVRVAPTLPRVLYSTEETSQMPAFDSFVQAQASYIQSQRVRQMALGSERLTKVSWPSGIDGDVELMEGLQVGRAKGAEIINVSFKHANAAKAQAALNAILDSYDRLKDESFGMDSGEKQKKLEDLKIERQRELDALRKQAIEETERLGTGDLDQLHSATVEEVINLDRSLFEINQVIAMMEGAQQAPQPKDGAPPAPPAEATLEQLALVDERLADLIKERDSLESQLRTLLTILTEEHRNVLETRRRLAAKEQEITDRAAQIPSPNQVGGDQVPAGGRVPYTLEQLKLQKQKLDTLRSLSSERLREIGRSKATLTQIAERIEEKKRDLDLVSTRLKQLDVEKQNIETGRVSIMQFGDLPARPATDRRLPLSAAGLLFGLAAGIGGVWLTGFARGGCRYADEIQDNGPAVPLLEVLPAVDPTSPEWVDLAAHSVHHVRSILNNMRTPGRSLAILVTSPTTGDGKTYFASALAHSFAMSGHKTIAVDADLVGHQLSARLGHSESPGLRDAALEGTPAPTYVLGKDLDVLPAGVRDEFQPEQLNLKYIEELLNSLRSRYDTVVIDTGPILGSLEANLVAGIADRVVLVVGRGQTSRMIKTAVARIRQLGGMLAGFVFNRAVRTDYLSSSYSASVSRRSVRADSVPRPRPANAPATPLLTSMRKSLTGATAPGRDEDSSLKP